MVVAVGYVDGSVRGDGAAVRPVESGVAGGAAVSVSAESSAGDGVDQTAGAFDVPDGVVFGVGYDDISVGGAAYPLGATPSGGERVSAVAGVSELHVVAAERPHQSIFADEPNAVALALGYVGVSLRVHAHGAGAHDAGFGRRASVALPVQLTGSGESVYDAGGEVEAADALVLNVGNEQPAGVIEEAVVGFAKLGAVAGSAVA